MEYNRLSIKSHPRESGCFLTRDKCDVQLTKISDMCSKLKRKCAVLCAARSPDSPIRKTLKTLNRPSKPGAC